MFSLTESTSWFPRICKELKMPETDGYELNKNCRNFSFDVKIPQFFNFNIFHSG